MIQHGFFYVCVSNVVMLSLFDLVLLDISAGLFDRLWLVSSVWMWQYSRLLRVVAERELMSSGFTELEPAIFQSNTRSSNHPSWFCPDAYNGKSLLWYKPWKSDVSPLLCLYLGQLTVARAALDSQLYQHAANPSDSHMDHSGRWVMRGPQGREAGCYEDMEAYPPTYKEAIQGMWTVELFLSQAAKLVRWRSGGFDGVAGGSEKIEGTSATLLEKKDKPSNLNTITIFVSSFTACQERGFDSTFSILAPASLCTWLKSKICHHRSHI